jgi:hypothetical protein
MRARGLSTRVNNVNPCTGEHQQLNWSVGAVRTLEQLLSFSNTDPHEAFGLVHRRTGHGNRHGRRRLGVYFLLLGVLSAACSSWVLHARPRDRPWPPSCWPASRLS